MRGRISSSAPAFSSSQIEMLHFEIVRGFPFSVSVQPGEKGFGVGGAQVAGDEFGLLAVVALGANADPIAILAGKLDHIGAGVLAQELFLELYGLVFAMECADLHAPAATRFDGFGGPVDIQTDAGRADPVDARSFG